MTPRRTYTRLLEVAQRHGQQHALDLAIACPSRRCGAGIAEECKDPQLKPGVVHFARRLIAELARAAHARDSDGPPSAADICPRDPRAGLRPIPHPTRSDCHACP